MNQNENNSNTLNEEISNYDTEEINQYIIAVREELKHLDSKNEELEKKNNEENIRYVESFIRIYEETIIQQAKDMETLSEQIKELLLTMNIINY